MNYFPYLKSKLAAIEQVPAFFYLLKWLFLCTLVGFLAGNASALFLYSLDWVTAYRQSNTIIIAFLPLAGLLIGLVYHYYGESVVKGNNQLLEEFHSPRKIIPLRMAPLVLFGTLVTHLFGGSAGREGTAVQMGGAFADQFTSLFRFRNRDRRILLLTGVSAGFASVFGTPLAGAVFALEVMIAGRMRYDAILPCFLSAVIADRVCDYWQLGHTHYSIPEVPAIGPLTLVWVIGAGILFGLAALLFSRFVHFWSALFRSQISYPPLRPFIGGIFIALYVFLSGDTTFIGLGIPGISQAFLEQVPVYFFLVKLLLTSFTLGAGFKGGEVTPLFFVGATLGSALSGIIPLPVALLAGIGFVAVFSGATNTPISCTLMGMELFGVAGGVYIGLACVVAYLFSGHTGIYGEQIIGSPKNLLFGREKGKRLHQIGMLRAAKNKPTKGFENGDKANGK